MTPDVASLGTQPSTRQTTPEVALATTRLLLRAMDRGDVLRIAALHTLIQTKDVDVPALDHEAMDELCLRFEAEWRAYGIGHLLVRRRDDGQPVGHIHLKWIPDCTSGRMAEITYAIDAPYQGNGYATEAVGATLGFAFDQAGLDYVIACVEPDNQASVRVAEKNGMAPIAQGRTYHRLMRRFLLPATMWRFHQRQRVRMPSPTGFPAGW